MSKALSPLNIFIVGPSCTGKTTLCNALSKKLGLNNALFIKEVARSVMREQGYTRADVGNIEMQKAIMTAQLEREDGALSEAERLAGHIILSDRSGIDPIIYATLTARNENEGQQHKNQLMRLPIFQKALSKYRQSIFVLLAPVEEWLVDDGVRSLDDSAQCVETFRRTLDELGIKYYEIGRETMDLIARVTAMMEIVGTMARL
ncbi:hypothetical protein SERLA73DRAFT_190868 [Serpula lacrymans var. lacrymans S7.3]|uniref:NadR/Ttd14 AAA domain-containing protein n=2 Tax=Serpula lacrymans var. lacrymans TaxID=341189 RepID=F8QGJ0_SERL3|nr:uncharacterized protein SERLADRAFT_456836 [Serpula lacrymans var. lacrymans S7.9]EGN92536.1 hypothetical protein SERLA73DRAFT_190868 [Serpula lacrymans var. lacrymans S7.3]EGO29282.1 hypothetical protein SERLADRAFT_456836 [Serpula lacrymans var. lacrymans S7.9]